MPNNTNNSPSYDDEAVHNEQSSYQELNAVMRQNLLMQLMATRQQQHGRLLDSQQYEHGSGDDDAMQSSLNEFVIRHNFQQHGSLQQLHDTSGMEATPHDLSAQLHFDTSHSHSSNVPFNFGPNNQHNLLGQMPQGFNPIQADDDILSMMLMSNNSAVNSSFFSNQFHSREPVENRALNDSEMLRAYNQNLIQSRINASSHPPQQQHGGNSQIGHAVSDLHSHMVGAQQPMHHQSTYASMYHAPSIHGPNRGYMPNYNLSEGIVIGEPPDRIVPTGMSSTTLGLGMLDSSHGMHPLSHDFEVGMTRPRDVDDTELPKPKKRRSQRKQPADKPRRALSAYNFFFSAERARILNELDVQQGGTPLNQEKEKNEIDKESFRALQRPLVPSEVRRRPHRKTHGKIGFQNLAQTVALRWKELSAEHRLHYQNLADKDLLRHKDAMEKYLSKRAGEKPVSVTEGEKPNDDGATSRGDNIEDEKQTESGFASDILASDS